MSRARISVQQLAKESNIDPIEVFFKLSEAGIKLNNERGKVPKSKLTRARNILNLTSKPIAKDSSLISTLSEKSGLSESEIRTKLIDSDVFLKKQLTRIPKNVLTKTETVLGLRKPTKRRQQKPKETEVTQTVPTKKQKAKKDKKLVKRKKFNWKIVGPEQEMSYLTATDVEEIHWIIVKDFDSSKDPVDPPGIKSHNMLESAVFRPKTSLGNTDKYPSLAMAGASLLHSIVLNHPFHNGNKRTALVSLLVFIDKNGWLLTVDHDTIYDFLLDVAKHNLINQKTRRKAENPDEESYVIAAWLQRNMRKITRGEHPLHFRELRDILETYDCTFEVHRRQSRINIMRGKLKTQIFYKGEGKEVDIGLMHKVRKELNLDEEYGYDSDIFYNKGPRIPEFIHKYRKVLSRLAKV